MQMGISKAMPQWNAIQVSQVHAFLDTPLDKLEIKWQQGSWFPQLLSAASSRTPVMLWHCRIHQVLRSVNAQPPWKRSLTPQVRKADGGAVMNKVIDIFSEIC